MQPIKIISVGKIKNKNLLSEIEELKKRLNRVEIIELKEIKDKNSNIVKSKEFELIKDHIDKSHLNFLLWEYGKTYSTMEFYNKIKKSDSPISFLITGPYGPSEELKSLIQSHLSLSPLTMTHEMAQLVLVEQIYRIQMIEKGSDYNK